MVEPTGHNTVDAERRRSAGTIFAIASGKGGVGKTWLAITLSHALARAGRRVLLFDGDVGLANIDIQLGLSGGPDLGNVVAGRIALSDAIQTHRGGFDILAGQSGSGALAALAPPALEEILTGLEHVASAYDMVLLDLSAGLDRIVRRLAIFSDTLLIVATDEPTSLTDAYAVMKVYHRDTASKSGAARIIVNLAATHAAGERTFETLRRAATAFLGRSPHCAGIVRRDDRVRDVIRRQTLLLERHPSCAAALDVETLCAGLIEQHAP